MESNHFLDNDGNPAGGTTCGKGFAIGWQNGPLNVNGERLQPNGAFVEDIIKAAIDRIGFYQHSRFRCEENSNALAALFDALNHLDNRTKKRIARGVDGTHGV